MNSLAHRHLDQGYASVVEFSGLEALGSMCTKGVQKKAMKLTVPLRALKSGCSVSGLYARLLSLL